MTNPDYTHVTLVVDRSGSMKDVRDEAEGGINALLAEQFELPGKLTVTLVEFDNEIDTAFRMSSEHVPYTLNPRGFTRLLDAVGSEIHATGADLGHLGEDERPGKVLFVVVTDGHENASAEYNLNTVRELISHQSDIYSWVFQFIGAGDAAWQGQELGMASASYDADNGGTRAAYSVMSNSMRSFRGAPDAAFAMPDVIDAQSSSDPA